MNAAVATRLAKIVTRDKPGAKISLTETLPFPDSCCDWMCCSRHSADSFKTNIDKNNGSIAARPATRNISRQCGIIQLASCNAATPTIEHDARTKHTALL